MKMITIGAIAFGLLLGACQQNLTENESAQPATNNNQQEITPMTATAQDSNPFFTEYETPFAVPPFAAITENHYRPAFDAAIMAQREEVEAIANNIESPTFANTIEALERSGAPLTKVANVFFNLTSAHTNDELDSIQTELSPRLAALNDEIMLNDALFQRVKKLWQLRETLDLSTEQATLLKETWKAFVRQGANLDIADKETLTGLNQELASLTTEFGQNLLAETNAFELVIDDAADLAGLPASALATGAAAAEQKGYEKQWVFTLSRTSITPFLTYSDRRGLREKMFKAYSQRGANGNENDNRELLKRIANLRSERARLLGYETHAHYVLEENMAKTPQRTFELLDKVWEPALEKAKSEARALQEMIHSEGHDFELQPWDWWYYSEKVRKARYNLDEEQLRQYFVLENVRDAAFTVAGKLYGISIHERQDIPVYQEDMKAFEVKDADGTHLGILYNDYFARSSKRGGAWMNEFRSQRREDGRNITPLISNVFNFSKPGEDKPSLLSWDEATTLFHEFGHALHGLLSEANYASLGGTNTPRDYVELPSQFMENWAEEPEIMRTYAHHWQTGEVIPDELIKRIREASTFNQGFITLEYMAASYLDMAWHTQTTPVTESVETFENSAMQEIGLIPEIISRYRSPYFAHIFSGGYSSGYYSYIWSEVLDADAFERFREEGILNPETGAAFREHILSRGSTEDVMVLYKRFRGREPQIEPLMKRRGLVTVN